MKTYGDVWLTGTPLLQIESDLSTLYNLEQDILLRGPSAQRERHTKVRQAMKLLRDALALEDRTLDSSWGVHNDPDYPARRYQFRWLDDILNPRTSAWKTQEPARWYDDWSAAMDDARYWCEEAGLPKANLVIFCEEHAYWKVKPDPFEDPDDATQT